MNTITTQPSTYAVVGVDEASPAIFVVPVIGWLAVGGGSGGAERFDPIVLVSIGLENATKATLYVGDALAFSRKTQAGKFSIYVLDVVMNNVPDPDTYNDRFKMVLRDRRVKS